MAKRPSRLESISRRFWFEHESGRRLYPYRSVEGASGRWAFRVAPPGAGANKNINQTLLDDEDEVYQQVFGKGWSVRLCDKDGKNDGLYNKDGYSIRGTSEDGGRLVLTADDYVQVLRDTAISEKARAFLLAHYFAQSRKASMKELALAVGYDSFEPANLHYGRLAHTVADALPMPPVDLGEGRYANWMQALSWADGERNADGHFVWTLRSEVATAMKRMGWVISEHRTAEDAEESGEHEGGTVRQALVAARRGQGLFRNRVLQYWSGCCAVTGCSVSPVLMASHIKPWSQSSDEERLDGFNGLLLTPNLDRLFDRHLITFDDDGLMQLSPFLGEQECQGLGVSGLLRIERLHSRHRPYLSSHREAFRVSHEERKKSEFA